MTMKSETCSTILIESACLYIIYDPEVYSACNRNRYQESSWGLRAAGAFG
jgi:hypothetical protein